MTLGVGQVRNAQYEMNITEYTLPIKGFILRRGRLVGIYVKEVIIPVTEELPREVHKAVVRGHVNNKITVREINYGGNREVIEILIETEYQSWTVFLAN